MSLPEACIRRPVMTTLITLSFIVFGLFAYRQLPVAALPRVDYPTINVQAQLPGASPETMAASVAAPLERQFSTIPGIDSMSSSSSLGSTTITLQFALDRNIDAAALDVQSAMTTAGKDLPDNLPVGHAVAEGQALLTWGKRSLSSPRMEAERATRRWRLQAPVYGRSEDGTFSGPSRRRIDHAGSSACCVYNPTGASRTEARSNFAGLGPAHVASGRFPRTRSDLCARGNRAAFGLSGRLLSKQLS